MKFLMGDGAERMINTRNPQGKAKEATEDCGKVINVVSGTSEKFKSKEIVRHLTER